MSKSHLKRWAIGGIAVALGASTLPAQVDTTRRDTTRTARSTTRIPIRKESRGEVVPSSRARVDSIALQAHRDSMRRADLARNDSIVAAGRMRTDSVNMPARPNLNTLPGRGDSMARARRDTMRRADLARNDSIVAFERVRTDSVNRTARPDSSALAARGDSIVRGEQTRTDSISMSEQQRNDSIARVSPRITPVTSEPQAMPGRNRRLPGSFYMGLAAGSALPTGDLQNLGYDRGMSISLPFGSHNPEALFGWRLMLGYNQFNGASFTTSGDTPAVLSNPDPKVYSAEFNLNARFPFNERKTSSVYLTGGGGVYLFRNFGTGSALGAYLGNDVLDPNDSDSESTLNKWGMNGGAGLEFGIGTSSLFFETRLVNVFAGRDDEPNFDSAFGKRGTSVRWMPLILGFTIR